MKLHLVCAALLVIGLGSPARAQPTPAQLDRIAALVEAGKLDEAKIRIETLLEVFPADSTLVEIQRLLREKQAAPATSSAPITPPPETTASTASQASPRAEAPPSPLLQAWLGDWSAEAKAETPMPRSGQIQEHRYKTLASVTLTVQTVGTDTKVTLHGECRNDSRIHYTDGKSAWHTRRHMTYEIPGRLIVQDTTVSNTTDNKQAPSLRGLDFDQALQALGQPTHVADPFLYDTYTLKRHVFSRNFDTLTLWVGAKENYESAGEQEVVLKFIRDPATESLRLSFNANESFAEYTHATVPAITTLHKVTVPPAADTTP